MQTCTSLRQERCLERIVSLPTPLGAEAAALLREKAPDSRLLGAVSPEGDDGQPIPRLADIAAMQRVTACLWHWAQPPEL